MSGKVSAGQFGFGPVWLGKVRGEWPIQCFVREHQAIHWLKNSPGGRVVGPIEIDPDLPAKRIEERIETRWID